MTRNTPTTLLTHVMTVVLPLMRRLLMQRPYSRLPRNLSGWGESENRVSDDTGARETRLQLLTLQGQWLEMKGNMLLTESSSFSGNDEVKQMSFALVISSTKGQSSDGMVPFVGGIGSFSF